MKTIAIVRFAASFGGIEHQIINMVSRSNKNYKYILITHIKSEFSEEFKKYGKVFLIDTTKLFESKKRIMKIVDEESIDILQSHMLREHYICCLCKMVSKKIYHIFRVHTYINCSFISSYKKFLYHALSKLLSRFVDLYLPISKVNYDELCKYSRINKKKIRILHDGVRDMSKATSSGDFDYYSLIMIANLVYGKGHDVAIRALAELVAKDKKYNITFIGSTDVDNGNDEYSLNGFNKLAKELNVLDNIKFLGYIKDVTSVLKDKSIFILPSYSEGTPNCLLEAMSAKKIVVASSVGGVPEFVEDSVSGFLHENKNYHELANKVLKIKKLPKSIINEIADNGYNTWLNEYNVEKICEEFKKIYEEVE